MISTSIPMGVSALLVLLATQASFLFTTEFSIDAAGITAKYPIHRKHYEWSQVKRIMFGREGCCFFTRKKASTLDGFSGLPVFYGDQRDDIEAVINAYTSSEMAQVRFSSGVGQ